MSESTLVMTSLVRRYRPVALWFWGAAVLGIGIALWIVASVTDVEFSLWGTIAGSAAKYWLGTVGVVLVSVHLKQFVSVGVTRHEFLDGAAWFALGAAVLFSVVLPVGHGVEQWAVGLSQPLAAGYPHVAMISEFLHTLPAELAYLVSGAAITAGYYRSGPLRGLLLMVPALLPVLVSEVLMGRDGHGQTVTRWLPLWPAIVLSLLVTALVAAMCHRLVRDVAIRRAAG
jgi:hypothetical protein